MKEYTKIQSIFKRDEKTHKFIEGQWSIKEFEYLKDNFWVWTEKVNGTNIRVNWDCINKELKIGGRTGEAQIPVFLYDKLLQMFTKDTFLRLYPDMPMCLYGEGYGARIQGCGGNYKRDGVDFVLFDVRIDDWWLERVNVEDIANKLGIDVVPIVGEGSLIQAIELIKSKTLKSTWGKKDFLAEGMVLRPKVELKTRSGNRVIAKLKHRDF